MTIRFHHAIALGLILGAPLCPAAVIGHPLVGGIAQLDTGALPRLERPQLTPNQLNRSEKTTEAAIREAEERFGGRAVGAKPIVGPNGTYHRVRLLQPDGRLRTVTIR